METTRLVLYTVLLALLPAAVILCIWVIFCRK